MSIKQHFFSRGRLGVALSFSLLMPIVAQAQQSVSGLINERLTLMRDVAAWKAVHHSSVENLQQEERVLNSTLDEAASLGLEPNSVRAFVQAQMDVAKAIQYRYRAEWLSQPENMTQQQPLDAIRKQIAALSSNILRQLADDLRRDPTVGGKACTSIKNISLKYLTEADKELICKALAQVRLKAE
ncbi:MAG: chorismate mutase [Enterobacterales bacterium endosymbiont of Blomia tropicalis]|uniref:chorismate mutase n=2 Tax=Mixta mediterraneensis TaxID=2758443 RepID=UPI0025A7E127|nr:chorismate mutase [Mixta mediterraneensis]MDL4915778.1 chorismate mutase [Mixta mediterraneensis]